ncbi:MAG: hypothetical protein M3464_18160 [Chloroflexota bacterium]|nr:hypothetical protein [Chloroflexota bacterium]
MTISNKRLRDVQRLVHLAAGIALILYLYTSLGDLPVAGPFMRIVVVPIVVVTGLAMWQLPRLRQLLKRRPAPVRANGA